HVDVREPTDRGERRQQTSERTALNRGRAFDIDSEVNRRAAGAEQQGNDEKSFHVRLAVWCSSSTMLPSFKSRTAPEVWLTTSAIACVLAVMPAAAAWRAPSPSGIFTVSSEAVSYRPAA